MEFTSFYILQNKKKVQRLTLEIYSDEIAVNVNKTQKDGLLKINILSSFTYSDVVPNPCPTRKKTPLTFEKTPLKKSFFVSQSHTGLERHECE